MDQDRYLNESLRIRREANALQAQANDYARAAEDREHQQAELAQAAFELTQRVPVIVAHAWQNAFEAALLAEAELRRAQKLGLSPEAVADFAMKQAVGAAFGTLQQVVQQGAGAMSPQGVLDALILQADLFVRLGPNPDEIVEKVRRDHARAQRFKEIYGLGIALCVGFALVGMYLKFGGLFPFDPADRESLFGALAWGAGPWVLLGYVFVAGRRSWAQPSYQDNYNAFGEWHEAWRKFAEHPGGSQLAQQAWQQVPATCEQISQRLMLGVLPPGAIVFVHDPSSEIETISRGHERRIARHEPGFYFLPGLETPIRADLVRPLLGRTTTRQER